MKRIINLDMDGTIVDFYGVDGWLDDLISCNVRPYEIAKPLVNFSILARQLNRLQKLGYEINIISWLCKSGTKEYNNRIIETKKEWLRKYLPSVTFNNITIVKYGTPKSTCGYGLLFDDELNNRKEWDSANPNNLAFDVDNILEILKNLK